MEAQVSLLTRSHGHDHKVFIVNTDIWGPWTFQPPPTPITMWYQISSSSWVMTPSMTTWEKSLPIVIVQSLGNTALSHLTENVPPPEQVWPVSPGLSKGVGGGQSSALSSPFLVWIGWEQPGSALGGPCRWCGWHEGAPRTPHGSLCCLPWLFDLQHSHACGLASCGHSCDPGGASPPSLKSSEDPSGLWGWLWGLKTS